MKKFNKAIILIPSVIVIFAGIALIAVLIFSPVLNDIRLSHFADQLSSYPLPENSQLIEEKSVCGKLNGNGNGMDYFACILIKSDLSINDIDSYYQSKKYSPARNRNEYPVNVQVIQVSGAKLDTEYIENQEINFQSLNGINNFSGYYVVLIYDGGYSAGFDIRGN